MSATWCPLEHHDAARDPCIVVPDDFTVADCKNLQWRCAVHRKDISAYDKAVAARDTKAEYPGITDKDFATDILNIDPGLLSKYFKLFKCTSEVQEATKAQKLTINQWVEISNAPDQLAALRKLHGSTNVVACRARC